MRHRVAWKSSTCAREASRAAPGERHRAESAAGPRVTPRGHPPSPFPTTPHLHRRRHPRRHRAPLPTSSSPTTLPPPRPPPSRHAAPHLDGAPAVLVVPPERRPVGRLPQLHRAPRHRHQPVGHRPPPRPGVACRRVRRRELPEECAARGISAGVDAGPSPGGSLAARRRARSPLARAARALRAVRRGSVAAAHRPFRVSAPLIVPALQARLARPARFELAVSAVECVRVRACVRCLGGARDEVEGQLADEDRRGLRARARRGSAPARSAECSRRARTHRTGSVAMHRTDKRVCIGTNDNQGRHFPMSAHVTNVAQRFWESCASQCVPRDHDGHAPRLAVGTRSCSKRFPRDLFVCERHTRSIMHHTRIIRDHFRYGSHTRSIMHTIHHACVYTRIIYDPSCTRSIMHTIHHAHDPSCIPHASHTRSILHSPRGGCARARSP
jgi:hypothetical protein